MARAKINQRGQTAVEYLFLIAVLATVILSILSTIKTQYLGKFEDCQKTAGRKFLLCRIGFAFSDNGLSEDKKFQYYPMKK